MHTIKLTVAYDGTDYFGWQWQREKPSIQGALQDVAGTLTQEQVRMFAAGRTDAGVHAIGQVVHFRTHSGLTPLDFQRAFNALLPPAIRVLAAEDADPNFHARFQATAKTYRYRISRARMQSPFDWRYALHYPFPLDEDAMVEATKYFVGAQDFSSFAASSGSEEDDADRQMLREIYSATIERLPTSPLAGAAFGPPVIHAPARAADGRTFSPAAPGFTADEAASAVLDPRVAQQPYELAFTIRGKSFLRYMVRKITGTLLDVGRGKLRPEDLPELFAAKDRSRSGPTVPPHGLCLISVEYPPPKL